MKRNILRLLLSAAFVMCCTFPALADLGTPPNNEIWYTTDNGKKLTAGKYDVGKPLCGSTISEHGKKNDHYYIKFNDEITLIGEKNFDSEDHITEISLPLKVTYIGQKAFYDCDGLVTFHMTNSVTTLGYCAFYHCDKLKNLTLGSSLESIGASDDSYGVFEDCDALESVSVPASVKYIGRNAFYDCDALLSFSCENVEFICPQAFYNCDNLKSVNLGSKLEEIRWTSQGNAYGVFEDCDALEVIGIPASVTTLGQRTFYDCNMLKFVAIGSGVTKINPLTFYNCPKLMSVAIENKAGLTIGENAFKNCKSLINVSFFGNTPPTSFGYDCFYNCPILGYHVLEENYDTYNSNSNLSGKVVAGPPYNEIWYTTNNGKKAEQKDIAAAICPPQLNSCLGIHGVQFFSGNPPELSDYYNCFYDCPNLVSVVLPSSITYIGIYAFSYCTNLVSVSIPSTVTGIGIKAFRYCESLQDIKLPAGLNYIGTMAFDHCSSLRSITIPSRVNTIPECAFMDCSSLSSVTFLGTITGIGRFAFAECRNLSEIFYLGDGTPECVSTYDYDSFNNCPATIYVKDVTGHGNWGNRPVRSWRSGRGNGSAASPLEIGSYPQLYGFSLEVKYMNGANLCAKLTADIKGSNNVLNEDGTPKGVFKQWEPIGGEGYGYRGEFDGGGHTVSGLYFNDESRQAVGLFGKAAGANDNPAHIHDVGVKDSYFRGKSHVGGICGDLAIARMENCWNGATVESKGGLVGGIAGSCYIHSTISNCHNVGKVLEGYLCGGVCGAVYSSQIAEYSLSNCVSLDTKCSKAYTLTAGCQESKIHNVFRKNATDFARGEVCWILNGSQPSSTWRQQLGVEAYPTLSGEHFVDYDEGTNKYFNYDDNISGSGTAADPYRIGNKFELQLFANIVNTGGYPAACGILTADIIVNNNVLNSNGDPNSGTFESWTPIGGQGNSYRGEFNGNGHAISGLYVNDASMDCAALFGKIGYSAYIHDLGVKDSYFRGKTWVAGICADLAGGKIEGCWNGATVVGISASSCAGGIAGSCWKNASVNSCYNTGNVSVESTDKSQCGSICGLVARNDNVTYSVSNCVSLNGKCDVAYNVYTESYNYSALYPETYETIGNAAVDNVFNDKDAEDFASGEVCWILNGNKYGGRWRQQLGTDAYPTTSGTYFVNYTDERQYYNNETSQEIWYTSTDGKIVTPYNSNSFGAGVTYNLYEGGQGVITFDRIVTSIGNDAFHNCSSLLSATIPNSVTSIGNHAFCLTTLQSATIPNSVTSIGESAFADCSALQSVIIPHSVMSIGYFAFTNCPSLSTATFKSLPAVAHYLLFDDATSTIVLDLTDSEKPYIGTSLSNYPGFTEARYHGTLEPGEWGTITLPFVPSNHDGIVFFSIDNVDAANGTLTLSIAENIVAGKPYLFRNQTDAASFTLTAMPAAPATNVPVTITASEQTVGSFALKGTFQAKELEGTGLYQLDDDAFVPASSLSIDPFRAYLKDTGGSAATSIAINCDGVLVTITNQDDSTVTLYGLKKVEFIKENDTPAVRVTYKDGSTVTYNNPKKVEFKKE